MVRDVEADMIASLRRLSLLRPSYAGAVGSRHAAQVEGRADGVSFVPELLFAVLLSHEACVEDLHRILRLECVRQWNGWRESEQKLLQCTSDEEKKWWRQSLYSGCAGSCMITILWKLKATRHTAKSCATRGSGSASVSCTATTSAVRIRCCSCYMLMDSSRARLGNSLSLCGSSVPPFSKMVTTPTQNRQSAGGS